MARIEDSRGRKDGNSAFGRIFGDESLGALFSRIHAAVIRSGYELEWLLHDLLPREQVCSLQAVRERVQAGEAMRLPPITVAFKGKGIVRSLGYEGHADVVIFNHLERLAMVIELKEGDSFDTKKAAGERDSLITFSQWLAVATNYRVVYSICCFHQDDKREIVRGLKGKFNVREVMTGRDFCTLIGLDYEQVLVLRKIHQRNNMAALAVELLRVPELRRLLIQGIEQGAWANEQEALFIFSASEPLSGAVR